MWRWSNGSPVVLACLLLVVPALCACGRQPRVPLLVISGPTDLMSFRIAEASGEVLWSIAADEPTTLRRIDYGSIPQGFQQLVPADDAPPRALIVGERLDTEMIAVEGAFYHEGMATGPGTFQPLDHRMVLKHSDSRSSD
jgi:hypothetical protein